MRPYHKHKKPSWFRQDFVQMAYCIIRGKTIWQCYPKYFLYSTTSSFTFQYYTTRYHTNHKNWPEVHDCQANLKCQEFEKKTYHISRIFFLIASSALLHNMSNRLGCNTWKFSKLNHCTHQHASKSCAGLLLFFLQ